MSISENEFKRIAQLCIEYIIDFEEDSYEEYLYEYFPEISEDDYSDIEVYGRNDMNHIYAYALQARDYLIENPWNGLGE